MRKQRSSQPPPSPAAIQVTPAAQAAVAQIPETQRGQLEAAIDRIMGSSAHLWHGRHGVDVGGKWRTAPKVAQATIKPGFYEPAAVSLYRDLLLVYRQNAVLFAHLASWVLRESDWRDMKVACAALLCVQPLEMFRDVGAAMMLLYDKALGKRAMSAKMVLRVSEFLENPAIAQLNRDAGFCSPASKQAFKGRWRSAAAKYLVLRERNEHLLLGLVKGGQRQLIMDLARRCGYRPEGPAFFQHLRWKQSQAEGGHRTIAIGMEVAPRTDSFDGLTEAKICQKIVAGKLRYAEVVGRLPRELGLTPAIMAALLPQMSDRDLIILTPTLESMGLLADAAIRARWVKATEAAEDQRSLNVAKNVKSEELKDKLEAAAGQAVAKAVKAAVPDQKIRILFLVDTSPSQEGALEKSKELVPRILAGLGGGGDSRLHVASFNSTGTVIPVQGVKPADIKKLLSSLSIGGGTLHYTGVRALYNSGVRQAAGETLILMIVGDEGGQDSGADLAKHLTACNYRVAAVSMLVNVTAQYGRGRTVRDAAAALKVPFSEVQLEDFDDAYSVPRILQRMLDAPTPNSQFQAEPAAQVRMGWLERVLSTPLLKPPVVPPRARGGVPAQ